MKRFNADCSSESEPPAAGRKKCRAADDNGESSTASEDETCLKGRSDMVLTNLMMFRGEETPDDTYSENGKSVKRIKEVLKSNLCTCSRNCRKNVNFDVVYEVCASFWSLSKAAQDAVLWGIQTMSFPKKVGNDEASSDTSSDEAYSSASESEDDGSNSSSSSSSGRKHVNNWYIQGGKRFQKYYWVRFKHPM